MKLWTLLIRNVGPRMALSSMGTHAKGHMQLPGVTAVMGDRNKRATGAVQEVSELQDQ